MLDFIKKIFRTKEKIGLTLESLDSWFDKKTQDFHKKAESKIKEIKQGIKDEIVKARENIRILEEAKLKNEKIPVREIQFMEGSKSFYIKRMKIFIDSLEIPEKELENFIEETKKRIDELGSSTLKAYQILQHFFEHEAYNIAQNIKKIDVFCRDLESSLKNKDIEESKAIKSGIKDLKDSIKNKEKLKNKIKEKENNIKDLEKEKNSIGSELSKKEQSQDYKDYYKLEVEKYQLQEDIEELKSEFLHYFSVLEHSLKKHLKISFDDEKLLARYIEDPINALLDDKNLGIIDILKKVENNVLKEVIDLKDKKKEKTLEVIQQINHEKINPFLDEYAKLKEKIKKISEDMSSYSVLEDIEKIKKMLEEKNEELEKAKKDAENLTKDILKIDISQLKKGLKEKIDDFLNVDLSLD